MAALNQASDAIRRVLAQQRRAITLKYASEDPREDPVSFKYDNKPYFISPGKTLPIGDAMRVPKERAYDMSTGKARPWGGKAQAATQRVADAEAVADFGLNQLWKYGVYVVTGDPAVDAVEEAAANGRWRKSRQELDEQIVGAYQKKIEPYLMDPRLRGQIPPIMGRSEKAAQARLDKFRAREAELPDGAQFRCPVAGCGFWSHDSAEMDTHRSAHGPAAVQATPLTLVKTAEQDATEKAIAEYEAQRQAKRLATIAAKKAKLAAEGVVPQPGGPDVEGPNVQLDGDEE